MAKRNARGHVKGAKATFTYGRRNGIGPMLNQRHPKRKDGIMSYYKTCPHCGAHLDPAERCDCRGKRETPAGATNTDEGKGSEVNNKPTASIAGANGGCQAGNDPRKRFPDFPMTEEEAKTIMRVEAENGFVLDTARGCALALAILRADAAELEEIIQWMKTKWGIEIEN